MKGNTVFPFLSFFTLLRRLTLNTRKLLLFVAFIVVAMVMAACGGGGGTTNQSTGGGGTPEDATKAFFTALFTEESPNISGMICSAAATAAEGMAEGLEQMKSTMASTGATIDISGFTYTKDSESGDDAQVTVAGKMKVSVAGVDQEVDFPAAPVKLKREGGAWKICG
jgi:hypothetical protein